MCHYVSSLLQYAPENIEAVVAKNGVKVHRVQLDIVSRSEHITHQFMLKMLWYDALQSSIGSRIEIA